MNKYLNKDCSLKDDVVIEDIRKAADMYENGELVEVQDMFIEIINAITCFEEHVN